MTFCFFIAFALGVLTDVAVSRPMVVSAAVVRDSRRSHRRRQTVVHLVRGSRSRRPLFDALKIRRVIAPLTGAASPRAPARGC